MVIDDRSAGCGTAQGAGHCILRDIGAEGNRIGTGTPMASGHEVSGQGRQRGKVAMTRMALPQQGQSAESNARRDGRAAPGTPASWSLVRMLAIAAMAAAVDIWDGLRDTRSARYCAKRWIADWTLTARCATSWATRTAPSAASAARSASLSNIAT